MVITRLASTALVALALVSLTGCSDSSPPVQAEAPTATMGETGATATDEATKFDAKRTGTWGFEIDAAPKPDEVIPENGAQVRVTLDVGELTRLSAVGASGQAASWAYGCPEVDEELAVLIPLRLTARNLSNASLPLRVSLMPANTTTSTFPLRPTMANETGCWDFVSGSGDQPVADFGGDLGPSKVASEDLVFVVRDYYGERFPDGQPTELSEVQLRVLAEVVGESGESLNLEQTCFVGDRDFDYFDLNIGQDPVQPRVWLYEPPADDDVEANSVDEPRCS